MLLWTELTSFVQVTRLSTTGNIDHLVKLDQLSNRRRPNLVRRTSSTLRKFQTLTTSMTERSGKYLKLNVKISFNALLPVLIHLSSAVCLVRFSSTLYHIFSKKTSWCSEADLYNYLSTLMEQSSLSLISTVSWVSMISKIILKVETMVAIWLLSAKKSGLSFGPRIIQTCALLWRRIVYSSWKTSNQRNQCLVLVTCAISVTLKSNQYFWMRSWKTQKKLKAFLKWLLSTMPKPCVILANFSQQQIWKML